MLDSPAMRRFPQKDPPNGKENTALRETIAIQIEQYLAQGGAITQLSVQIGTTVIKRTRREQVDHIRRRTWNNGNKLFDNTP